MSASNALQIMNLTRFLWERFGEPHIPGSQNKKTENEVIATGVYKPLAE